jgi:hypothetical protein
LKPLKSFQVKYGVAHHTVLLCARSPPPSTHTLCHVCYPCLLLITLQSLPATTVSTHPFPPLQGYLVGNGVTDDEFDGNAYLPFAAGKSLISELTLARASQACGGHFWNGTRGSK